MNEKTRVKVLGFPARSTYHGWVKAARNHKRLRLSFDTLQRISAVLSTYKALRILFDEEKDGLAWLLRPQGILPFTGRPPMVLLTSGTQDGLMTVRRFLDAAENEVYTVIGADEGAIPITRDDIVYS